MQIGLFFGSFNPIHTGHLIIANHVLNETSLEKIWFIVSPMNPFKTTSELLDERARLSLVKAAIKNDDRIEASDVEFALPKPSFTINTLGHLKNDHPHHQFSIIMGSDNFRDIDKWKDFEGIVSGYKIWIYLRTGFEVTQKSNTHAAVLKAPIIDISSTQIRKLIKQRKSIRYLVPDTVRKEIEHKGYYKK